MIENGTANQSADSLELESIKDFIKEVEEYFDAFGSAGLNNQPLLTRIADVLRTAYWWDPSEYDTEPAWVDCSYTKDKPLKSLENVEDSSYPPDFEDDIPF